MQTIRTRRAAVLMFLLMLLAGCSGAPDAGDVQPLLQKHLRDGLRQAQSAAHALGGDQGVQVMRALGAPAPEDVAVENVRVLESRQLDNGDYALQLRYDIVAGDNREIETRTATLDLLDSGWRLLRLD